MIIGLLIMLAQLAWSQRNKKYLRNTKEKMNSEMSLILIQCPIILQALGKNLAMLCKLQLSKTLLLLLGDSFVVSLQQQNPNSQ